MPDKAIRVAVIGATSSLAQALCHVLAAEGAELTLVARDAGELQLLASDLALRHGAACRTIACDLLAEEYSPITLMQQIGEFDRLVLATGDMGNADPGDLANLAMVMHVNTTLPAQIATLAAEQLAAKGSGVIAIISSVAGDRGRQSNIAYGSAKAALTSFASGLRNRFYPLGVHVLTVKPGFVDTPMTWGMASPLIARREAVARAIARAMRRRSDVLYAPWFWRYIMLVIRHIPETVFKRLKL